MPPAAPSRVVVVGAGLGGLTVVERLRAEGHEGPLVLVGDETEHPYDRPPLSKQALRDGAGPAYLRPPAQYPELDLELRLGDPVRDVEPAAREVVLGGGDRLSYDALVLAPGAAPRRLPALDGLSGVHVLRTHADAVALRADVLRTGGLVVIGGGFVGCEAAASVRALDVDVDLVELLAGPLVRVLGPRIASRIAELHRSRGVRLHSGVGVTAARSAGGRIGALELTDGSVLPAPTVLVGLGVAPATGFLTGRLDLGADGAVLCDARGRTSAPGVWALGDAASWQGPDGRRRRFEHWTSAVEQGAGVAHDVLGTLPAPGQPPYFWSDQYDVLLQAVGEVAPGTEAEVHESGPGLVALHAEGDRLTGVVALDAKKAVGRARRLLRAGVTLDDARHTLLP